MSAHLVGCHARTTNRRIRKFVVDADLHCRGNGRAPLPRAIRVARKRPSSGRIVSVLVVPRAFPNELATTIVTFTGSHCWRQRGTGISVAENCVPVVKAIPVFDPSPYIEDGRAFDNLHDVVVLQNGSSVLPHCAARGKDVFADKRAYWEIRSLLI
jgi:hypothetical protein